MSDFLTGLVNRTRNTEVALQRRRPSLFEPNQSLLSMGGQTQEYASGETEQEQIMASNSRNIGPIGAPSINVPAQSAPITPHPSAQPASSNTFSTSPVEQNIAYNQSTGKNPGTAGEHEVHYIEHLQTIREIQVEKLMRPVRQNTDVPSTDGIATNQNERVTPVTALPLQRLETIREIQVEKPVLRSLTNAEGTTAAPVKAVSSADSADHSATAPMQHDLREQVVQANDVKVTQTRAPNTEALSPKPKEQVVREVSTPPVPWVAHNAGNARRESTDFSQMQRVKESTPTIQVTIGRIEVRATQQAAGSSPARPVHASAPRLSLDDYLRQRNGGG